MSAQDTLSKVTWQELIECFGATTIGSEQYLSFEKLGNHAFPTTALDNDLLNFPVTSEQERPFSDPQYWANYQLIESY